MRHRNNGDSAAAPRRPGRASARPAAPAPFLEIRHACRPLRLGGATNAPATVVTSRQRVILSCVFFIRCRSPSTPGCCVCPLGSPSSLPRVPPCPRAAPALPPARPPTLPGAPAGAGAGRHGRACPPPTQAVWYFSIRLCASLLSPGCGEPKKTCPRRLSPCVHATGWSLNACPVCALRACSAFAVLFCTDLFQRMPL